MFGGNLFGNMFGGGGSPASFMNSPFLKGEQPTPTSPWGGGTSPRMGIQPVSPLAGQPNTGGWGGGPPQMSIPSYGHMPQPGQQQNPWMSNPFLYHMFGGGMNPSMGMGGNPGMGGMHMPSFMSNFMHPWF